MRDLIVVSIVVVAGLAALRRPWIGVMLWTWLSTMNPHRMSWGFAYDAPLAAVAAACTILGLVMTKDRESPFKGPPSVWLALFMLWMTLSWALGLDPADDYPQWNKVMKIDFMIFVALALLQTKRHADWLVWVAAGSLAILGVKGGLFTLAHGGNYRVWGPPQSFIEDNNEFALALVMTIPLLRYLQMQLANRWAKYGLTAAMLLCAVSALGSHSRGALVAIGVMVLVLWWRGKSRVLGGILIGVTAMLMLGFLPEEWFARMSTISTYEEDASAMGRISAWWTAWGIAQHHLLGVGFNAARPELFELYSPHPEAVHAAHSIYFQVMGNHGFIGLAIFLGIFVSTYLVAGRLRKAARSNPAAQWCGDLGAMAQVSLIGYAVGGAFLSLSYFDLPYNILVAVLVANKWLESQGVPAATRVADAVQSAPPADAGELNPMGRR